jgi:hypothetical protein
LDAAYDRLLVAALEGAVRVWTIRYRAHNGLAREAYVALPRDLGPSNNPALPLIISPHGRGIPGLANLRFWGDLPARGRFAVISPDGYGRVLPLHSWGWARQIDDLANMQYVAKATFDSPTDLARRYRDFPRLPNGRSLQELARREVGGVPESVPGAYARRSPINFGRAIAFSRVPLQLFWSVADEVVLDQVHHSARLFRRIRELNPPLPLAPSRGAGRTRPGCQ